MKTLFLSLIMLTISSAAFSQSMYVSKSEKKGVVNVYVSEYDNGSVDLRVYKEDYESKAKGNEGRWYLSDDAYNSDFSIHFVDSKYDADLVIYYESSSYNAGWKNTDKSSLFD